MPLTLKSRLLLYCRRPPTAGGVTAEEVLLPEAPVMGIFVLRPTLACPASIKSIIRGHLHCCRYTTTHPGNSTNLAFLGGVRIIIQLSDFHIFGATSHVKPIRSH